MRPQAVMAVPSPQLRERWDECSLQEAADEEEEAHRAGGNPFKDANTRIAINCLQHLRSLPMIKKEILSKKLDRWVF